MLELHHNDDFVDVIDKVNEELDVHRLKFELDRNPNTLCTRYILIFQPTRTERIALCVDGICTNILPPVTRSKIVRAIEDDCSVVVITYMIQADHPHMGFDDLKKLVETIYEYLETQNLSPGESNAPSRQD